MQFGLCAKFSWQANDLRTTSASSSTITAGLQTSKATQRPRSFKRDGSTVQLVFLHKPAVNVTHVVAECHYASFESVLGLVEFVVLDP